MAPFTEKVIQIIRMIPQGKVASYGQIALYAGLPRAARQVGWILRESKEDMPWWRVLNNTGRISIEGNWQADKSLQKKLLERDGVVVSDEFILDIEKYRWKISREDATALQLSQEQIDKIIALQAKQETLL
jgi:methylated-DNA-protein-cysteine methyltransferase related protein